MYSPTPLPTPPLVVGVVGLGVVGATLARHCRKNGCDVVGYDASPEVAARAVMDEAIRVAYVSLAKLAPACRAVFVCVPTPEGANGHALGAVEAVCEALAAANYAYPLVLRSTVCPGTTDQLATRLPRLSLFHSPEFLSASTRAIDICDTPTVTIGVPSNTPASMVDRVDRLMRRLHPDARLFVVRAVESEASKLFCNAFYALKLRAFTGFREACASSGASYDVVRQLMVQHGWIHPMHTYGADGVGGGCLPKDSCALGLWLRSQLPPDEGTGETSEGEGEGKGEGEGAGESAGEGAGDEGESESESSGERAMRHLGRMLLVASPRR